MKSGIAFFLVSIILLAGLPATGYDGVEVLIAGGQVRHHVNITPSPTPGYCYWESGEVPLTSFHATEADGYGNMDCPHPWMVHADADSLVYRGTWPVIDSEYVTSANYLVELSYSVVLTRMLKMSGVLVYSGDLEGSSHSLIIDYPGGSRRYAYATEDHPHYIWADLLPGMYQITLNVVAIGFKDYSQDLAPYEGFVAMKWEEPDGVPTEAVSWGSVKALYRD